MKLIILVRDVLYALTVIPTRYEHLPIRNTHGKYRNLMKRGYSKSLYSQRNKDETIVGDKATIWRTYCIKTSEDTEQRIIIQMHSIQYPQTDQYCCDILYPTKPYYFYLL